MSIVLFIFTSSKFSRLGFVEVDSRIEAPLRMTWRKAEDISAETRSSWCWGMSVLVETV